MDAFLFLFPLRMVFNVSRLEYIGIAQSLFPLGESGELTGLEKLAGSTQLSLHQSQNYTGLCLPHLQEAHGLWTADPTIREHSITTCARCQMGCAGLILAW